MTAVSNASPLINLARIGQLDLLRRLRGNILIPEAVRYEVVEKGAGQPGAREVATADWISVRTVSNTALVHALQQELDQGEAEAIVLAIEVSAEWLLMDERIGRDVARHMGVHPIGVVGLLVEAKQRGLIAMVRPILDALRDQAGFRLSEELYRRVLRDVQETG